MEGFVKKIGINGIQTYLFLAKNRCKSCSHSKARTPSFISTFPKRTCLESLENPYFLSKAPKTIRGIRVQNAAPAHIKQVQA
jgi:hypothetical protein